MNVKKSAVFPPASEYKNYNFDDKPDYQYTIEQLEDNSIRVSVDSTKSALRFLAKQVGFEYDDHWNTRQLGSKLIDFLHEEDEKSVVYNDSKKIAIFRLHDSDLYNHTIEQLADGSIQVTPDSTKAILRLIVEDRNNHAGILFDCDESWTTQQLGSKLIDIINKPDNDWKWWMGLSRDMRILILYYFREYFRELNDFIDEDDILEVYYNEEIYGDRDGEMGYIMSDYISDMDSLNVGEFWGSDEDSLLDFCMPDFSELAYLTSLESIIFDEDQTVSSMPKGLDKLKQLKRLSFYKTNLGEYEENPNDTWDSLLNLAKSLPNLEYLNLQRTYLELSKEQINKLQELMPNCDIHYDDYND